MLSTTFMTISWTVQLGKCYLKDTHTRTDLQTNWINFIPLTAETGLNNTIFFFLHFLDKHLWKHCMTPHLLLAWGCLSLSEAENLSKGGHIVIWRGQQITERQIKSTWFKQVTGFDSSVNSSMEDCAQYGHYFDNNQFFGESYIILALFWQLVLV